MSTDAKRAGNARYLATQKTITVRTRPENAERLQIAAAAAGESVISIHALLAESDSKSAQNSGALLRI